MSLHISRYLLKLFLQSFKKFFLSQAGYDSFADFEFHLCLLRFVAEHLSILHIATQLGFRGFDLIPVPAGWQLEKSGAGRWGWQEFQRRRRDIFVVCRPKQIQAPSGATSSEYAAPDGASSFVG
jgi:hypothetical protein